MERRQFAKAAAALITAGAVGAGGGAALGEFRTDDDSEPGDVPPVEELDDVAVFVSPAETHDPFIRMYDAASGTVAYARDAGPNGGIELVLKDASGTDLAA